MLTKLLIKIGVYFEKHFNVLLYLENFFCGKFIFSTISIEHKGGGKMWAGTCNQFSRLYGILKCLSPKWGMNIALISTLKFGLCP